MRWDRLFDDLQAQLDADGQRELDLEVSDRTRRERAQVGLHERLIAHKGMGVELRLAAGVLVSGTVADAGSDWLLVHDRGDRGASSRSARSWRSTDWELARRSARAWSWRRDSVWAMRFAGSAVTDPWCHWPISAAS